MNYFDKNKKKLRIRFQIGILACIFIFNTDVYAQYDKKTVDSLETLLRLPSISDNDLLLVYKKLTKAYLYTDAKKSLEYAKRCARLAEKTKTTSQIANSYLDLGEAFYFSNQLDSSLYYYEQSLAMQKEAEENGAEDKAETNYLQLLQNIGTIHEIQGKYDLALDYFLKALTSAEKINNLDEAAKVYVCLASTYVSMSNMQQAEAYYLKGEKLFRQLNDSSGLADACMGLSNMFIVKSDYSKALKYGEEAYRILSVLPNIPDYEQMFANQQMTDVWLKIPDYGKAMEYAKKTVDYARRTGVSSYMASALYTLSTAFLKQGKYKESEETASQALTTDTAEVYVNSLLYGNITQANIWMGNSAKGIEYFSKTTNAIRAYSNKNFQSSLAEMETKYQTEEKEIQITALKKEKRLVTGLGMVGAAVLLLALAMLFLLWRWTVQKKRVAEKQKQLAEQQIKQLEQEKQLIATQSVLDGETRERVRLARDLHDGLGSMLTGAKLSLLEMKKGAKLEYADVERFDKAVELLDQSVHEMRRVAHHLMPDSLSRFGLKSAVGDFCNNYSSTHFTYYGDESRLDTNLEVMIYRSIHELVNNALKHSGAAKILVQIIKESDRIAFTVQDDGCGFDLSTTTQGTGLQNIRTRVASYNGILNIDSRPGEGTEINVELRIEN